MGLSVSLICTCRYGVKITYSRCNTARCDTSRLGAGLAELLLSEFAALGCERKGLASCIASNGRKEQLTSVASQAGETKNIGLAALWATLQSVDLRAVVWTSATVASVAARAPASVAARAPAAVTTRASVASWVVSRASVTTLAWLGAAASVTSRV